MTIIYKKKQINGNKLEKNANHFIMIPIMNSAYLHYMNDSLSCLLIYDIDNSKEYCIIKQHCEYDSNIDNNDIKQFINQQIFADNNIIYTDNKKRLLNVLSLYNYNKQIIDINYLYFNNTGNTIYTHNYYTTAHTFYFRLYYSYKKVFQLIPIVKHFQYFKNLRKQFIKIIHQYKNNINEFLQYIILYNFAQIEKNGLYVNKELFYIQYSGIHKYHLNKNNNLLYTIYNFTTNTGRPSNRHGSINFAALNKNDNTRKIFVSRFGKKGKLMEVDYSAYHLALIGTLINYKFPINMSIHQYMAQQYFKSKNVNSEQIKIAKQLSFQLLYGNDKILDKYNEIEFLSKVKQFKTQLWNKYQKEHAIKLPLSNKVVKNVNNKGKLFNYYIQGLETEYNTMIINDINQLLINNNYKSKLILYTYDSFLFDLHLNDINNKLIDKLIKIISKNNQFYVHKKMGENYKELYEY